LNHNELVGWRERNDALAVVILRNKDDFQRNKLRIDITKEIISKYTDTVIEIYSKGQSLIQRSLYLVHLVDWVSWHLAGLTSVDAMEIRVIDYLKSELSGSKS
jgi:glucose/mannose-6-phosphate isomerase